MSTEHPGVERLRPTDPETIGPYRLLGRLGEGGMGTVYLALAPTGRHVAVKVVKAEFAAVDGFAARFHAEVDNARRVASFCTAQVLDNGDDADGRPYMVTEYIAGVPLSRQISRYGALDPGPLHGVALGVAAALAAIHVAGLVHRDLKPANVILSMSGPRVIDFGVSRALDRTHGLTVSGEVLGSPGWWSPEQVRGLAVTPAADIFAWGCLIAYAGTGRHPFGRGDAITLAARVLRHPPDLGTLPAPLHDLVRQATAMDPAQRPTAQELVLALVGGAPPTGNPGRREDPPTLIATDLLARSWEPPANVDPDSVQTLVSLGVEAAEPLPAEPDTSSPPTGLPGPRPPADPAAPPPAPPGVPTGFGALARQSGPGDDDATGRPPHRTIGHPPYRSARARPGGRSGPSTADDGTRTALRSPDTPERPEPARIPPDLPPRPAKRSAGRRWLIAAGAVTVALGGATALLLNLRTPSEQPPRNERVITIDVGQRVAVGSPITDPQLIIPEPPRCGLAEHDGARPVTGRFCAVTWTLFNPGAERAKLAVSFTLVDDRGTRHRPHGGSTPPPAALEPGDKVDGVALFDLPRDRTAATLASTVTENGGEIEVRLS